jgi:hypothetical protein
VSGATKCLDPQLREVFSDWPISPAAPGPRLVHMPSEPSGSQRSPAVSSGRSFAQVAGAILRKQARGQNPDKDEAAGSSPARPTTPGLTCGNACRWSPSMAVTFMRPLRTAVRERIPALLSLDDFGSSVRANGFRSSVMASTHAGGCCGGRCGAGDALDGGVDRPTAPMRMSALAARASMGSCACLGYGDALGRPSSAPIAVAGARWCWPAPMTCDAAIRLRADRCGHRGQPWSAGCSG